MLWVCGVMKSVRVVSNMVRHSGGNVRTLAVGRRWGGGWLVEGRR